MSQEEISQNFSDEYNHSILTWRLLLASFFSMGVWVFVFEIGWWFFFFMQCSQTVPNNLPGAYQYFENYFRIGILLFMLSVAIGILFPFLSLLFNKTKNRLALIAFSGMIVGAVLFYSGTLNINELVELKSPFLILVYGAAFGYLSALLSHGITLGAFAGHFSLTTNEF